MAKSQETYSKKEKEKKRLKKRQDKQEKKEERKNNAGGSDLMSMMVYVDENGFIVDTPPNPLKRKEIDAESIEIGIPRRTDEPEDHTKKGRLDYFDSSKGFGFIKDMTGKEKFFVHINNFLEEIVEGDKVEFEVENGARGPVAVNVKLQKD